MKTDDLKLWFWQFRMHYKTFQKINWNPPYIFYKLNLPAANGLSSVLRQLQLKK